MLTHLKNEWPHNNIEGIIEDARYAFFGGSPQPPKVSPKAFV